MQAEQIKTHSIGNLSSTMLIPLWAKAVESEQQTPLLDDPEAVRMMKMIDYDFAKFAKAKASQVGCCARAAILDNMAQRFIAQHPDAIVVHLGAGLDARYERLGKPKIAAWYDLDLPEVIAFRAQLLPALGNHYLAFSLFDRAWIEHIQAGNRPVLLIIEGVLMYFSPDEVQAWFAMVAQYLPQAEIIFDAIPPFLLGRQKQHDSLRHLNEEPPVFRWAVADEKYLENMGLKVLDYVGLSSLCRRRYPYFLRLLYLTAWGRKHLDMRMIHAKFNSVKMGDENER